MTRDVHGEEQKLGSIEFLLMGGEASIREGNKKGM
jgi:hypothetical protein